MLRKDRQVNSVILLFDYYRCAEMDLSFIQRHDAARFMHEFVKGNGMSINIGNTHTEMLFKTIFPNFRPRHCWTILSGINRQHDVVFPNFTAQQREEEEHREPFYG